MKIAIVAPPWIPVPPPKYGGIEIVVWNLVEGLKELGQEVMLFALRESKVSCKLYPYIPAPVTFGIDSPPDERVFVRELALKYAFARAGYEKADIIHDHTLFKSTVDTPTVHTVYGKATEGSITQCLELLKGNNEHLISVSNRQKERFTMLNHDIDFIGVVHHAINVKAIEWSEKKEDFFLSVGRASWEKGFDSVLKVAAAAKAGLVLAIKMIDEEEKEYVAKEIEPLIENHPKGLFLQLHQEVGRDTLLDLLRRSKCILVGDKWEQPFSILMIEALACGTPIVAFRRGAASEIIEDGKTGFVVDNEEEMVEAIKKVDTIKPKDCRKRAEEYFSRERMAKKYLDIYKKILSKK
ncbi:MAG: glycosyltransferase family 4 protein [Candidatus Omnitrophota bacterium]